MKKQAQDSVAEARRDVDVQKARLAATIAELRRRADPQTVVAELRSEATHTASELAQRASRLANSGVASVKRRPEVAGAAVGGVGLIAALIAWRQHSKRTANERRHARLMSRASVNDVLDPPADVSFNGDDGLYEPLGTNEIHGDPDAEQTIAPGHSASA